MPIAADDLDTRVRLQPLRDRGGRTPREQINDLMALEITHHGPKASPSPPGPFVEPDAPWGRKHGQGSPMAKAHHRPVTPREAQGVHEPCAGTAAHRSAHLDGGLNTRPDDGDHGLGRGWETARQKSAVDR